MKDDLLILQKKVELFNTKYFEYKKQNIVDDIQLKEIICDILSWFEICLKNVSNLSEQDRKKISAIKYVNNMKKHSISIYTYTLQTYCIYPSDNLYPSSCVYPSTFNICWSNLPLDKRKYINQYNNYNECLKGKNIYKTINEILDIVKNVLTKNE